jgi:ankyrin repeat protein
LVVARQNQILASIYYDRHTNKSGPALSNSKEDIENAEKHAKTAFNKRFKLLKVDEPPEDEVQRHNSCTALLVRILETRDKTVEANELTKLLSPDTSSVTTDSLRRRSTNRPPNDFVIVEDKHELLINAIRAGDSDSMQSLLNGGDVNVEQLSRDGKTPLMHAIEVSDETIVHKLLDPAVGADVSTANKRGLTALHVAASHGLHDMVRCLLHHDAEMEVRDKRGETALMKAVQNDQGTIVQILSDAGADMDTKNADEWSLLHYSIRLSKMNMINQLLDIAPDLRDSVDQAGKTALHHCADLELVDQAAALLAHKNHVDVNAMDSVSRSPLYFAASKPPTPRRESMVRLLVDHDARVDESRPPPRYRDYSALKPFQTPRRASKLARHDSISTTGSIGTTSTGVTKLSRIFSGRMHMR